MVWIFAKPYRMPNCCSQCEWQWFELAYKSEIPSKFYTIYVNLVCVHDSFNTELHLPPSNRLSSWPLMVWHSTRAATIIPRDRKHQRRPTLAIVAPVRPSRIERAKLWKCHQLGSSMDANFRTCRSWHGDHFDHGKVLQRRYRLHRA